MSGKQPSVLHWDSKKCTDVSVQHTPGKKEKNIEVLAGPNLPH